MDFSWYMPYYPHNVQVFGSPTASTWQSTDTTPFTANVNSLQILPLSIINKGRIATRQQQDNVIDGDNRHRYKVSVSLSTNEDTTELWLTKLICALLGYLKAWPAES